MLAHALERARVHGPVTNRDLLVASLRHPDFAGARLDTGFYDRHLDELTAHRRPPRRRRLAALAAALADAARTRASGGTVAARLGGWRNVPSQPQVKTFRTEPGGARPRSATASPATDCSSRTRTSPGVRLRLVHAAPDRVSLEVDGVRRDFDVASYGPTAHTSTSTPPPRLATR